MRLTFCAACGSKDDLQHHDLVTRSEGDSDDERQPLAASMAEIDLWWSVLPRSLKDKPGGLRAQPIWREVSPSAASRMITSL